MAITNKNFFTQHNSTLTINIAGAVVTIDEFSTATPESAITNEVIYSGSNRVARIATKKGGSQSDRIVIIFTYADTGVINSLNGAFKGLLPCVATITSSNGDIVAIDGFVEKEVMQTTINEDLGDKYELSIVGEKSFTKFA